ncbi:MAG: hypothetical protein Q8O57_06215 [Kiritimatiellota bacterium]|nr:hypothetical protein [Kiritimatiellota bacterium]
MGKFYVGLDLGQAQDFTAMAIAEQSEVGGKTHYAVRHLERFKLGTLYPAIVARVAELMKHRDWELIVDQTGVGRAVFDMLGEAGLRPIGVTIHGGDKVTSDDSGYRVPKRELIGTMQAFLQSKRLHFLRKACRKCRHWSRNYWHSRSRSTSTRRTTATAPGARTRMTT